MIAHPRCLSRILLMSLFLLSACSSDHKAFHSEGNILRVAIEEDPKTLDPRLVRDLPTTSVIYMLYEGLMRAEEGGKLAFGIAEAVDISPDQTTYTFHLRPSSWSDGQPVTALDFKETWTTVLDPKFPSPNAYQLYLIKGAREAKEGKGSLDAIGVHAKDASTLVVELQEPTPYFLDLTATYFFYPVSSLSRNNGVDSGTVVTNGPFQLESWKRHNEFSAIPNPHYWDRKNIRLDAIHLLVLDPNPSLELFKRGELDWAGSPLSTLPVDTLASLRSKGELQTSPAAGIYFFRVNTDKPPFNNVKMRRAFALAVNRTDLVNHVLKGGQIPASGVVPYSFLQKKPLFDDGDVNLAQKYFKEALEEQSLTLANFPPVSIHYTSGERGHKIAQVAQQQWKNTFGVTVNLQSNESKVQVERLKKGDYQLGVGSWFADYHDPISFLEVFKFKENGTNNTGWENPHYIALLNASASLGQEERKNALREAEKALIHEMPVIPLFFSSYNYVENPAVKGVYFSELGYLDFKRAFIE